MNKHITQFGTSLRRAIDREDVLIVAGIAMIVRGLAEYSPPAAWIVAGLIVLWLGVRR